MPRSRKRVRRSSRRRSKTPKLTASSINRALTSQREFRKEVLAKVVTTSANSDWPVVMIIPSNSSDPKGRFWFTPTEQLTFATKNSAPNDSSAQFAINLSSAATENNPLRFYKNWCVNQIRNVALNPVEITIYDCMPTEGLALGAGLPDTQTDIFYLLYQGWAEKMAAADVQAVVRTMAEGIYGAVPGNDYGFLMKNYNYSVYDSDMFMRAFKVRTHKVTLAPGESYVWKVKGFMPFDYSYTDATINQNELWKHQSYFPIVKARGEVGLSSTGEIGYSAVNLALVTKYGGRAYRKNLVAGRLIHQTPLNAPVTGTVILGPSDDVQVA